MPATLLLPVIALVLVMLGGLVVLRLDTRAQLLERRIAAVGNAGVAVDGDGPRSIRLAQRRRAPVKDALRRFLQVPTDLPGAHVMPVGVVAMLGMAAGVGAGWLALLYFRPHVSLLIAVAVGLLVTRTLFGWECRRYADRLRRQMPDMIELLASSVRAGLPVAEAFRGVARELPAPTREEFGRVVREMALGNNAETALMALHQRSGVAEYAIFAVTLGVQARSGGRLAETVQLLAETVRQRIALAARASALAGEAKVSAYVLSGLPFIGGAAMAMTQKGYLDIFLHQARGRRLLMIGIVLMILGQLLMSKMISSATRD